MPIPPSAPTKASEANSIPRPPIVVRNATFLSELSEESFEQYFADWQHAISSQLPEEHREPQWRFELDGYENGLPKLKSTQPSMLIDAWNEKTLPDRKGKNGARVVPSEGKGKGGVSFSVDRGSEENSRSYLELRHFFSELLPVYQECFKVREFHAVELHYQNLVRSDLFPEFDPSGDGGINLSLILETHRSLQLPGYGFLLPYKHEMTCEASNDPETNRIAEIRIEVAEPLRNQRGQIDGRVNLLVDFRIFQSLGVGPQGVTAEKAVKAMDDCHEKMLEFFSKTFTEHAREVFSRGIKKLESSPTAQ